MKTTVKLMAMATAMVALASCMGSDSVYDPDATAESAKAKYEKLFVQEFGKVASNQDWGFGTASTRTAVPNANQWAKDWNYTLPDAITDGEIEAVKEAFSKKIDRTQSININWTDFWVQQVYVGRHTEYKTYPGQNGTSEIKTGIDYTDKMGPLYAYKADGTPDYTENLKAQNCNNVTGDVDNANITMLFQNSGTSGFAYMNSLDSKLHTENYVILKVGDSYYVGFDFESDFERDKIKYEDDNVTIKGWYSGDKNVDADGIYDDWIVKISPARKNSTRRIMCEDLGATANTDLDFNDVVFDAYFDESDAVIILHAAGGTYPLTVGGKEVHELFGVSQKTMVNTYEGKHYEKPVVVYRVPFSGSSLKDIPVVVTIGEGSTTLEAPLGKPATKICAPELVDWANETRPITEKYDKFPDYVKDPTLEWWEE